jgi:hypothetical protein
VTVKPAKRFAQVSPNHIRCPLPGMLAKNGPLKIFTWYYRVPNPLKPSGIHRKKVRFWAKKPDSFNLLENGQSYRTKLLDVDVGNLV